MAVCPACRQENPAGSRFCNSCGSPLAAEPPRAREERKVVTVLFCDLVGFTSRAESMDPEDVRALLSRYHERVRRELERHGGTVEKLVGDGVMALFGAPQAHEDDPERAVRAALAIRDGIELTLRVGITTGEALVTLDAEATAAGDVVNTASRLQTAAPENGILVDGTTYRATARAIEYRAAHRVDAKGKSEAVTAWEVLEARGRIGVDVPREAVTPLVGRSDELDALAGALARARKDRAPQLATVVGVPGIGKSRLVYELFQVVEAEPDLITWRQGRSLPYGEGVTFWALAEMIKAETGILETDSAAEANAKLGRATTELFEDAGEGRWIEGHVRPLVGLEAEVDAGGERRAEAFAAWRRFFEALAEERPVVLVFEDLHWADDGLLDFVDHLVDWAGEVPLLVVGTARPELLVRRPGWGGGKPNAVTVSLSPLSRDETARLVHALLDRSVLPAGLQATLLERAGGNPLYAEEFARMVEERSSRDDAELPLPESLHGIIAARLDALPVEEKALVQEAAVLGKVFWPGALTALGGRDRRTLDEALHALERKQFVRRERRSSVAGETQHAFLHLLVRDVAYGQIPRAQRAEKHRLAAEWIESLTADRSEDRAEMLAHHYLAALELAGAAGLDTSRLVEGARPALRDAGDRAFALNAFAAARQFYGAALDLASDDDPERPYLVIRSAQASGAFADPDVGALEEAVDALVRSGDLETATEAAVFIVETLKNRGSTEAADDRLERAISLMREAPLSPAKVRVLAERSRYHMIAGRFEAAVASGREVLPLAEDLGLDDVRASLLNNIGTARVSGGDEGGFADLEESLAIGDERRLPGHLHRTYHNLMESYRVPGRLDESARALTAERASDERFGLERSLRWVVAEEAVDGYLRGDWDAALARAESSIGEAEAGSPHYQEAASRVIRASIRLARGDASGADEDSTRALELGRRQRDAQVIAPALAHRAFVLLSLGRPADASALVDEALALPLYYYGLVYLAWAVSDLQRQDDLRARSADIEPTPWRDAALAIASGDVTGAAEIYARMGDLAHGAYASLRSGSEPRVRRALDFYRSVGATRYVAEGEALLAATA